MGKTNKQTNKRTETVLEKEQMADILDKNFKTTVCRAEVETQMQRTNVWTPRGETPGGVGNGGVMNWAIGIDMYTLMCIKLMTNKNLLYKKINKIQKKKGIWVWYFDS